MWIKTRRSCSRRRATPGGTRRSLPASGAAPLVIALVLVLGGCSTQRVSSPRGDAMGGMGPALSVERFLQAANGEELDAMAGLFGTADGPIGGDRQDIELRMDAIARILEHEDYEIVSQRQEPGREHPTTRVLVDVTKEGRTISDVPFLVVQSRDGGWLIEEIGLERITGG